MKKVISFNFLQQIFSLCLLLVLCTPVAFSAPQCESILKERHQDTDLKQVANDIESSSLKVVPPFVFARILRGKNRHDFEKLSTDSNRHIVMLMDGEGILDTFGETEHIPPLEKIGYTRNYIKELVASGTLFKLILIKKHRGIRSATWKNLGYYLKSVYGKNHVVYQLFNKYFNELKNSDFSLLVQRYGPTIQKWVNSTTLTPESSLWEFRSFLYNELRLTELYTGNGYTQTPDGQRGLAEYFILNTEIRDEKIGPHEIIDLTPFSRDQ